MVWYGDLTGWDWMGRDGMGWDGMGCVSRSRAAGAPRLGEGWHTQVHVRLSHDKLRHPYTLDGIKRVTLVSHMQVRGCACVRVGRASANPRALPPGTREAIGGGLR